MICAPRLMIAGVSATSHNGEYVRAGSAWRSAFYLSSDEAEGAKRTEYLYDIAALHERALLQRCAL